MVNKNKYRKTLKNLLKDRKKKVIPKNIYPHIFINVKAFLVFSDYQKTINRTYLSDYSFIYRVMIKDGLIHNTIKVNTYKNWIDKEFEQTFIKIKTLDSIGVKSKIEIYNTLIEKHKPLSSL